MPQIDVVLKFASRAAAIAALSDYVRPDEDGIARFSRDRIMPDIKVWRVSQDVIGTDGEGNSTVTHNYLAGYYVLVSLPRVVPALRDRAEVQFVYDRDKANARQSGAVLRSTVGPAVLQDIRFEPVFAGSDLPFGAWS
jgi:hypothetical protein